MERIKDFDYWVDEDGNVYNAKGRRLKPRLNTWGYTQVILCQDGKRHNMQIHTLVMQTFVGPQPEGYDIDHINYDRADNRLENLRYVTTHWNRGFGRRNCGKKLIATA